MTTGLVVAAHGRRGILEAQGLRHRFISKGRRLQVVCGDVVDFELRPGSEAAWVTAIRPRRNTLARAPDRFRRGEVIAANISQLVAVCAPLPEPEPLLLDRHACTAEMLGCRLLIVCNKADLAGTPPAIASELAALGYPLLPVSTRNGSGLEALGAALAGHTSVLLGQSGVGKSSLINALFPAADAAVGELSASAGTGTHTTTAVIMYEGRHDMRLIDTPGVRDFLPAVPADRRLDTGFREIHALAAACRFSNCSHVHEPGCAVKAALETGAVSGRRHDSYLKLLAALEAARPAPGTG